MTYHRKAKHSDHTHNGTHYGFTVRGTLPFPDGGSHVTHTDGPGCWMDVPATAHQPTTQQPPTAAHPVRQRHTMALPYHRKGDV